MKFLVIFFLAFNLLFSAYNPNLIKASLGLKADDYNFLMGFSGLLFGFTVFFFTVYTLIEIAKSK